MERSVVITGLGALTPLSNSLSTSWHKLINSVSAINNNIPLIAHHPCKVAGILPDKENILNSLSYNKSLPDYIKYSIIGFEQALQDAHLNTKTLDNCRSGICFGTGLGSIDNIVSNGIKSQVAGFRSISPYFIPYNLHNTAAGIISNKYNLKGPTLTLSSACSTGLQTIGEGYRIIKDGMADTMICGSFESFSPLANIGFSRCLTLSNKGNKNPELSIRPFDKERSGTVLGEGGGVIVLEEENTALKRNAKIYGRVIGYSFLSSGSDSLSLTEPSEDGAYRAMEGAIKSSNYNFDYLISNIDYINAHATGTIAGDIAENNAIKKLFKNNSYIINISSTKAATGHLLGGAGSLECCFTILSIYHNIVPPTLNLHNTNVNDGFDLNYTPLISQKKNINFALSNSFGFGSINSSILFSKY